MPIPVGDKAEYTCQDEGKVTDHGDVLRLECLENGQFEEVPNQWLTSSCRNPAVCTNVPEAPVESKLSQTQESSATEFQYASYPCKADGWYGDSKETHFRVQCPLGGNFPAADDIDWPNCTIEHCLEAPSFSDFAKITTSSVAVNDYALYECITSGQVTDNGVRQKLQCQEDGSYPASHEWPACRYVLNCFLNFMLLRRNVFYLILVKINFKMLQKD